jgi:hypothetical protein
MNDREIRLLVFGGRDYPHESFVHEGIIRITDGVPFRDVTIIHGDANRKKCRGADYWAHTFYELWSQRGIAELRYPAAWEDTTAPGAKIVTRENGSQFNVLAGFQRNQRMLDEGKPTHALGTSGGNGTADMRNRIEAAIQRGASIALRMIEE